MDKTTKTLTVDQVLKMSDAVDALFDEHIKYQINVAYRLYQLKKELNEMSEYIVERIFTVIPKLKDDNVELNDEENIIYQTILSSPIEIDTFNLTRAEIYLANQSVSLDKPSVELHLIENLEPLF